MKDVRYFVKLMICSDGKFFGPGIVELLERVEKTQSLSKASRQMSLAYTKALKMVRTAETALGFKLLAPRIGGEGGGGSELTEKAYKAINAYKRYKQKIDLAAQEGFEDYLKEMNKI